MGYIGLLALALGLLSYACFYNKTNIFGKQIWRVNTKQKIIALTFDDGPNEPFTSEVLALLKKHDQKATFFVVGKNIERFPGVIAAEQKAGHEVGLHSYQHLFRSYFYDPLYKKQIAATKKVVHGEGVVPTHFRFPWLFRTPWLVASIRKHGYGAPIGGAFGGLFEPFQPDGAWMAKHAVKLIKPGAIIIFHDGYNAKATNRAETVKATKLVLEELDKQGYKSVTITQLLALKN